MPYYTHTHTHTICFTSLLLYGHISYPAHFRVSGGCEYINIRLIRAPSLGLAATTPMRLISPLTQQVLRDSQHFSVRLGNLPSSCEQFLNNTKQIVSIWWFLCLRNWKVNTNLVGYTWKICHYNSQSPCIKCVPVFSVQKGSIFWFIYVAKHYHVYKLHINMCHPDTM